jgi:nucleoside-diphosphate-sugar epimerase
MLDVFERKVELPRKMAPRRGAEGERIDPVGRVLQGLIEIRRSGVVAAEPGPGLGAVDQQIGVAGIERERGVEIVFGVARAVGEEPSLAALLQDRGAQAGLGPHHPAGQRRQLPRRRRVALQPDERDRGAMRRREAAPRLAPGLRCGERLARRAARLGEAAIVMAGGIGALSRGGGRENAERKSRKFEGKHGFPHRGRYNAPLYALPARPANLPPMSADPPHLLCFGLGYTAARLARRLAPAGWRRAGTGRAPEAGTRDGIRLLAFARGRKIERAVLDAASHVLVSVPPDGAGDPVLDEHGADLAASRRLRWLGYLSTTSVYGDRGGGWVDETAAPLPTGERGRRRLAAEDGWRALQRRHGVPVHIFRVAGIYGPGRSPLEALRAGRAQRVAKAGQVFSRIHVEDLVAVLLASIDRPRPGAVYNVCDDDPAAPDEVVAHAATLLGVPAPPLVPFADAELSPVARSFYDDNKRVANGLIKAELGVRLAYPSYREGLAALAAAP